MNLEITDEERQFLNELFDDKQRHLIQELNHTDTNDFELMLRQKIELLEGLMGKVGKP